MYIGSAPALIGTADATRRKEISKQYVQRSDSR